MTKTAGFAKKFAAMEKTLMVRAALLLSLICFPGVQLQATDYFVNVYPNGHGLLTSESEEVAVGSDVDKIFNEGWRGGNVLADEVSS